MHNYAFKNLHISLTISGETRVCSKKMFFSMSAKCVKARQNSHRSVYFFDILYYLCQTCMMRNSIPSSIIAVKSTNQELSNSLCLINYSV